MSTPRVCAICAPGRADAAVIAATAMRWELGGSWPTSLFKAKLDELAETERQRLVLCVCEYVLRLLHAAMKRGEVLSTVNGWRLP